MLHIAALAASAALLAAAPAYAGSIHISTAGKSPEEVKAEVTKAAAQLCWAEDYGSALREQVDVACVHDTVRAALEESHDPALVRLASR